MGSLRDPLRRGNAARHLPIVRVTLDDRVRFLGPISAVQEERIREAYTYQNPAWSKALALGFGVRGVPKYLSSWSKQWARGAGDGEGAAEWSVPRGSLDRLRVALAEDLEIEDARVGGDPVSMPEHRVTLYDYQERLVSDAQRALEAPVGAVLWRAPQGSGKTTAALALATRLGLKTLVVVSTTNLQDQWVRRVEAELGMHAGVIGGGRTANLDAPIVVGMQQSLRKVVDSIRLSFGLVLADEVQLFAAKTFSEVVDRLPARYRLGVSGDERRADRKEFLIYERFGDVASEVTHADLVERGFVHEVEVRIVPTAFDAPWYRALGEPEPKPGESEEARRLRGVQAKVEAHDRLMEEMGADPDRNALVLALVQESVRDAGQAIVLSSRREHCRAIDAAAVAAGLRSGLLLGGAESREAFAATLRGFQAHEIAVAVGTNQAIGVGFDLPQVARGVMASPVANAATGDKQWRQYRGRFARTADGKTDAVVYYLWDSAMFGRAPVRHLCRWNRRVRILEDGVWVDGREWSRRENDGDQAKKRCEAIEWRGAGAVAATAGRRRRSEAGR